MHSECLRIYTFIQIESITFEHRPNNGIIGIKLFSKLVPEQFHEDLYSTHFFSPYFSHRRAEVECFQICLCYVVLCIGIGRSVFVIDKEQKKQKKKKKSDEEHYSSCNLLNIIPYHSASREY